MSKASSGSRRNFIKTGLLGFGGVLMLPSCLKDYSPFLFLTEDEAACLLYICEQIIPADENGPGAIQSGVVYYIDKQLHDVFTWDQETYRKGLKAIQESSLKLFGKKFEELENENQLMFLKKMEANGLEGSYWEEKRASDFFSLMISHSMQGFYGPPRHGGNKNYISYRMMRLEYPYIVGRNKYNDL